MLRLILPPGLELGIPLFFPPALAPLTTAASGTGRDGIAIPQVVELDDGDSDV